MKRLTCDASFPQQTDLGLASKLQTPAMSPQRSQSALGNIPRVVLRPTWDNVVASSYLIKVLEVVLSGPAYLLTTDQGIVFFLLHPFLHPLLKARLLPAFLLSVFVYFNLFFWTLLPQVLFLKLFHTVGSAWVNAVFLVLGEGAAVVALLFESFLVVRYVPPQNGRQLFAQHKPCTKST